MPRFDPTINLGHLLTGLVLLAGIFAGWYSLTSRVEVLEAKQAAEVARLELLIEHVADTSSTGRMAIQGQLSRDIAALAKAFERMEQSIGRMEERLMKGD